MPGSRPHDGWQIIALEVMPDPAHLFVKAHPTDSPSHVANQFKGLTSRVGVTHFLTTSAGEHVPNSRYLARVRREARTDSAGAGAVPARIGTPPCRGAASGGDPPEGPEPAHRPGA